MMQLCRAHWLTKSKRDSTFTSFISAQLNIAHGESFSRRCFCRFNYIRRTGHDAPGWNSPHRQRDQRNRLANYKPEISASLSGASTPNANEHVTTCHARIGFRLSHQRNAPDWPVLRVVLSCLYLTSFESRPSVPTPAANDAARRIFNVGKPNQAKMYDRSLEKVKRSFLFWYFFLLPVAGCELLAGESGPGCISWSMQDRLDTPSIEKTRKRSLAGQSAFSDLRSGFLLFLVTRVECSPLAGRLCVIIGMSARLEVGYSSAL